MGWCVIGECICRLSGRTGLEGRAQRDATRPYLQKESFSMKDTQCSDCLWNYNAVDRLQQIPACGHAFHMECIDLWLSTHTTCPLCRVSLLAIPSYEDTSPATDISIESGDGSPDVAGFSVNLLVGGETCPA